jgi:hypothetical protein
VVDATLKAVNKDPEDDPPLDVVAGLYSDKTAGAARHQRGAQACTPHRWPADCLN